MFGKMVSSRKRINFTMHVFLGRTGAEVMAAMLTLTPFVSVQELFSPQTP